MGGGGLRRDVGAGGVGRAGSGYDFVCADDRGSGAGARGDGDGAFGDEFGGATAVAGVWEWGAEESLFEAAGGWRNFRRVLFDGASGGVGCSRHSGNGG